jgi:glutaredoxin
MVSTDNSVQALPNSARAKRLVVYTSNGCHKCSVLKEWLKTSNRSYEERNLENVDVMTDLVMRNIVVLSAPVLEVDDSVHSETEFFEGDALAVDRLQGILEGNGSGQR